MLKQKSYPVSEYLWGVNDSIPEGLPAAGRDGAYDPIVVSRLRGRSRYGAAKARLDHKKSPSVSSLPPW